MNRFEDTDLREALRRNYADMPQIPADFNEQVMNRLSKQKPTPLNYGRRWGWILAAAASVLLLLMLHCYSRVEKDEKPVMVQQTEKKQEPLSVETALAQQSRPFITEELPKLLVEQKKKHKPARKRKAQKQQTETTPAEGTPKTSPPENTLEEPPYEMESEALSMVPTYIDIAEQMLEIRMCGERLSKEVEIIMKHEQFFVNNE